VRLKSYRQPSFNSATNYLGIAAGFKMDNYSRLFGYFSYFERIMTQQNNYINFNKKTVFVVGAGASLPYGYPLGDDLVEMIIKKCQYFIKNIGAGERLPQYKQLLDLIILHEPFSIDSFLAHHCNHELQQLGKELIVECILECENLKQLEKGKQVKKFKPNNFYNDEDFISANWYRFLTNALMINRESLEDENEELPFRIITFNYDVSLEYYLISRLQKAPLLKNKPVIFKKLKESIIHVYGSVRDTDKLWDNPILTEYKITNRDEGSGRRKRLIPAHNLQDYGFPSNRSDYGVELDLFPFAYGSFSCDSFQSHHQDLKIKDTEHGKKFITSRTNKDEDNYIKVIGEERGEVRELLQPFKEYIADEAERIMFLGFGFDNQNMKLLFDYKIIENIHSRNEEQYHECVGMNEEEYFEKFEICYTNYEDSEKLNRRIKNYCRKEYFTHSKSIKGVYEALTQDFDLD
jgi:hypothetical protein